MSDVLRLWIRSDDHFEQGNTFPVAPEHDVLVHAGDCNRLSWVIETFYPGDQRHYGLGPKIYVPGNHDYYGAESIEDEIEAAARRKAELEEDLLWPHPTRPRIDGPVPLHVLNPGTVVVGGVRFVGATLWTDYALLGDQVEAARLAQAGIRDYFKIRYRAADGTRRPVTPEQLFLRHQRELAFLDAELAKPFEGETVLVTHHSATAHSVPERFRNDPYSPCFHSALDLVERHRPYLYVHGHIHDPMDYSIGRTRVICNPQGYGHEPYRGFRPDLVVEVPVPTPRPSPRPRP